MARRVSRATQCDMVALLRAQGGFSAEDVSAALGIELDKIDEYAMSGFGYKKQWTPDGLSREVLRFRKKNRRWPSSKDFRDMRERRFGLPSWDGLTEIMLGYKPHDPWGPRGDRRTNIVRNQLRTHGSPLPAGAVIPQNGWVALQWYMAFMGHIPPKQLLTLPNALIRRLAMERYGIERLCREHARAIMTDPAGTLWRFDPPDDALRGQNEAMVYLEVENKTPEPDGTLAHYFLRVPPEFVVPRLAVAWTFGITGEDADRFTVAVET